MTKNKDVWTLTNIPEDVRTIAKTLAKKEGTTISSWISDAVRIKANHKAVDVSAIVEVIEGRVVPYLEHKREKQGMSWWGKK